MEIIKYPKREEWPQLLQRPEIDMAGLEQTVSRILQDIQQRGDEAVLEYTRKFDHINLDSSRVTEKEWNTAESYVKAGLKKAIEQAAKHIEMFHRSQQQTSHVVETSPGVQCWQKSVPIEKVGLYVPGGTAPLFSSVLMLGIPAKIAGCQKVVLCTPPREDGTVHPAVLYASKLTGVTDVFKIGGVQAIGAMTYGTATIPAVHKIFGPGNQYVTAAKQVVSRNKVAIDMPAGPSEVAVMADETSNPAFVAADLLSQAEHGNDSQVLLVTTHEDVIKAVSNEISRQLEDLPRKEMAREALKFSKSVLLANEADMIDMINEYAPEHLIIALRDSDEVADKIINAGSVFLGHYSPESVGDYTSGTNHTLPTNGFARAHNGVNLDSFVKKITFQKVTEKGLHEIGHYTRDIANAEGMNAHARAVTVRMHKSEGS